MEARRIRETVRGVDEDAFHAYFSLLRTVWWLVLTAVALWAGWLNSVVFVSLLSIWALVETSFAAYRADRNTKTERQLAELDKKLDRLLPPSG